MQSHILSIPKGVMISYLQRDQFKTHLTQRDAPLYSSQIIIITNYIQLHLNILLDILECPHLY